GDRVELIGRIVEVTRGSRKRGKAPAKHYAFINFGSWRGNVVKISIWSEGLAKLKEQPSNSWIGRWVSVTGLMDVPLEGKRKRHQHLSITVQEEGQIQQIDEAEAGVSLGRIAAAPPHPAAHRSGRSAATAPPASSGKSGGSRKRAAAGGKRSSRRQTAPTPTTAPAQPAPAPPAQRPSAGFPRWAQVLATLVVII